MDITPTTHILRMIRSERVNLGLLFGEAIDNSFDAAATSVWIERAEDKIVFKDDGVGITRDKIHALVQVGKHIELPTTKLGTFGIGIKTQAAATGDRLSVDSTSREGRLILTVDWKDIEKSGSWQISDPKIVPIAVGAPTNTKITITELRRHKATDEKLREEIAMRFHPALVSGMNISFNGAAIQALPVPEMSDIVDCRVSLSGGRSLHIHAGVLLERSKLSRVNISYGHRVIMPQTTLGCGDYSGLNSMFARVVLGGVWHLSKYKDDLSDEDEREELERVIEEKLRPILEKCNSAAHSVAIDAVAQTLNEMAEQKFGTARPKKTGKELNPGEKSGRSGFVRKDSSDPDGPAKTTRPPRDTLIITFDGNDLDHGVGEFVVGKGRAPSRVNLARDNPYIAFLLAHRDAEAKALSLFAIVLAIYEQGRPSHSSQSEMEFAPFGKRIASLLAMQESRKLQSM